MIQKGCAYMQGALREYFVCANSAQGFINFFPTYLVRMQKIYILKGGPGTGKSSLMKRLGLYFLNKGLAVDFIHCSSDTNSLDGVVIDNKIAVVDGTAPHVIEPIAIGAIDEYINLGSALNPDVLSANKENILDIHKKKKSLFASLYTQLATAKHIHDKIEKNYIEKDLNTNTKGYKVKHKTCSHLSPLLFPRGNYCYQFSLHNSRSTLCIPMH